MATNGSFYWNELMTKDAEGLQQNFSITNSAPANKSPYY